MKGSEELDSDSSSAKSKEAQAGEVSKGDASSRVAADAKRLLQRPKMITTKSGYLYKLSKSGLVKSYLKRWCILSESALVYHTSESQLDTKGKIDMNDGIKSIVD